MILIRADANEEIGTGHIMRCLSIADAFVQNEHEVKFVTADHRGDALIQSRGFEYICLDSEWSKLEEEGMDKIVRIYRPELLLVDSYNITKQYISSLSRFTTLAYIDDLNEAVWELDFLINYNIFGTMMDYSGYKEPRTRKLLGPSYSPLRAEFKTMPKHKIDDVKNVMVSAGGADPEGISENIIANVCKKMKGVLFHFIIGALNPRLEKIRDLANEHKNVVLHINERNMSSLMKSCDIAISAAGSTLYELCACGTPTITYTLADNQLLAAEEFVNKGIMISAGDCRENEGFICTLEDRLRYLIEHKEKRSQFSGRMQSIVDGYGADRLAKAIWDKIYADALDAVCDLNAVEINREGNKRITIGKTRFSRILVVKYELIDNVEKILYSSIANEEEVEIYNGAYNR